MKPTDELSTWAINEFPIQLRRSYASHVKEKGITIRDHLVRLVETTLKKEGKDIDPIDLLAMLKRAKLKKSRKITHAPANQTT